MAEDVNSEMKSESSAEDHLSIDKIVDAAFEPKAALKTFILLLIDAYKKSPAIFALLMASVLGVGVISRAFGLDLFYMIPPSFAQSASFSLPILRNASWIEEAYTDQDRLARGKALSRPYVLRKVIQ